MADSLVDPYALALALRNADTDVLIRHRRLSGGIRCLTPQLTPYIHFHVIT